MFNPKFAITPKINNRIAEIEKLKILVDQARILPQLEMELRFRATVESVHSSTSIEGNPLNKQQVEKVLHGEGVSAPDYALSEVLNYKTALDWLAQECSGEFMSAKQTLHLHKLLMNNLLPKNKIGAWRSGPIYVVDEVQGKEVVQYEGPAANNVPKLVSSFFDWSSIQNQKQYYHPVLLAGLIHYIFVSIHPFADGNGRTTRLLTYHYLQLAGYDFKQSISLDGFYLQHRQEYYDALSRAKTFDERMEADLTSFIDFFSEGFLQAAKNISHYIKIGKITDENKKPLRLNQDELQILDFVYEFGSIDVTEVMTMLSVPRRTAQRRLMRLVENKILQIEGKGPATNYVLRSKKS